MEVNIIEEQKSHKLAAVFADKSAAINAEKTLLKEGEFTADSINIIRPEDDTLSKKIEPESTGIYQTLIKSHLWLGLAGIATGVILAGFLISVGPLYFQASPITTVLALAFFGMLAGMMLAGVVSIRPDHDLMINKTTEASQKRHWTLIVHVKNRDALSRAKDLLQHRALSLSETL
ncbi:hypothetical protein [Methylophaga lonarensis]|nr:hypothetical protein [Methylophaga lonarensis]